NQESRLPPGSDFRRWVWITIAPFVTTSVRTLAFHTSLYCNIDHKSKSAWLFWLFAFTAIHGNEQIDW
ncbi:hypothetical protein R9K83_00160, partial [Escherichia coli]